MYFKSDLLIYRSISYLLFTEMGGGQAFNSTYMMIIESKMHEAAI